MNDFVRLDSSTDSSKEAFLLVKSLPNITQEDLLDVGCASGKIPVLATYSVGLDIGIKRK